MPIDRPKVSANPLAQVSLSWMIPLMKEAQKGHIDEEHLFEVPHGQQGAHLAKTCRSFNSQQLYSTRGLLLYLLRTFWPSVLGMVLAQSLMTGAKMLVPQLLGQAIKFIQGKTQGLWIQSGWGLALSLFGAQLLVLAMNSLYNQLAIAQKQKIATSLTHLVYEKMLALTPGALSKHGQGRVVNLTGGDANRLAALFRGVIEVAFLVINVVSTTYFLFQLLSHAVWPGVGGFFVFLGLGSLIMKRIAELTKQYINVDDKRVKRIRELLTNIQYIKLAAMEDFFKSAVNKVRQEQTGYIRSYYIHQVLFDSSFFCNRIITPLLSFMSYIVLYNGIEAGIIYPALSYFMIFEESVMALPKYYQFFLTVGISGKRMVDFLKDQGVVAQSRGEPAIRMKNADFEWEATDKEASAFRLDGIDLAVEPGSLVVVVGKVGSGKSSLIGAILGDMKHVSGENESRGSFGYCAQTPWILSGTIEENILFGQPRDDVRLRQAIHDAGMSPDMEQLPDGIHTVVGERGSTLSGGQCARLSLARALYQRTDFLLLDDPLASLDAHIGAHVFENAIRKNRKRTIVLVTHQLQFVEHADYVIVMDQGRIVEQGSVSDLRKVKNGVFSVMMQGVVVQDTSSLKSDFISSSVDEILTKKSQIKSTETEKKPFAFAKEHASKGAIRHHVYVNYFKSAGGIRMFVGLCILTILYEIADFSSQFWLAAMAENRLHIDALTYLKVYSSLNLALVSLSITCLAAVYYICFVALKTMHSSALDGILKASMSYFEGQPLGRMLNRFSNDVSSIDMEMYSSIINMWMDSVYIITALLTVTYTVLMLPNSRYIFPALIGSYINSSDFLFCWSNICKIISTVQSNQNDFETLDLDRKIPIGQSC